MNELKENLLSWYNFKENADILDFSGNVKQYLKTEKLETDFNKKYDYVILIGQLEKENKEENLKKAIDFLKDDGVLLIAENNKFGIKNWNGKKDLTGSLDYREITREYDPSQIGMLAKNNIIKMLKNNNINNYKFYYLFPDYNLANLIITDDYIITEEDITRNFESYEEGELVSFNENLALTEIVKEDPNIVKFFANSFLIEASKKEILTDVKYISFTNYRKSKYRVLSMLGNKLAIKKPACKEATAHINNISNNLKNFPKGNVKEIEVLENGNLVSEFINDTIRLDLHFKKIEDFNIFKKEFNDYIKIVCKNTLSYENVKDNLPDIFKKYDANKLSKLNYLEYAFTDMLPKNCFLRNGEYLFFDQEWCEKYYPAEYIIYRAIKNTSGIEAKFGEKNLFNEFEILDYIDLFEELEENFRNKVIDENMLYNIFDKKTITREAMIADFTRKIIDKDVEIEKLKTDIEGRKAHVSELLGVIEEKEKQIIAISNSLSWKITKPLRDISGKLHNIKNKKK